MPVGGVSVGRLLSSRRTCGWVGLVKGFGVIWGDKVGIIKDGVGRLDEDKVGEAKEAIPRVLLTKVVWESGEEMSMELGNRVRFRFSGLVGLRG